MIDESALRRPLGGVEAMRAQLRHLIEVTEYPRVTLQVMPFSRGGHPAAGGSFTVLRFAEPDLRVTDTKSLIANTNGNASVA